MENIDMFSLLRIISIKTLHVNTCSVRKPCAAGQDFQGYQGYEVIRLLFDLSYITVLNILSSHRHKEIPLQYESMNTIL